MAIIITQQSLSLSGVRSVVVTPVAQDGESGEYVRELRIFADAATAASPIPEEGAPPDKGRLVVTLRLQSTDRTRIAISVPSTEF